MPPPRKYSNDAERLAARRARRDEYRWEERAMREASGYRNRRTEIADRPSPAALAERDQVASASLSLTAFLFGDPPPGRSALDRRGG